MGLPAPFLTLIGRDERFLAAVHLAAQVAATDTTVLLRGESGSGKEVLALALHRASRRRDKALVRVNCAAIPDALLESELFGYEEGSFTGARRGGKPGKFELAHEGTLFLDEVGDMSLAMQAKLLRAIQDGEIERLGASKPLRVDVRLITATHRDLEGLVAAGQFRADLYYRLNVVPIWLPPLRERKGDLPAFIDEFLRRFGAAHGRSARLSDEARARLLAYDWPGNVRELRNAVEHMVVVCPGDTILPEHLPPALRHIDPAASRPPDVATSAAAVRPLREVVAEAERRAIVAALEACGQNRSEAMRRLRLSRRGFYLKLRRYGLDRLAAPNGSGG